MPGFEKEDRFREAFNRGQSGNIDSYDAWLQDHGFVPSRVTDASYIRDYLQEHPNNAPNHDDELETIAEFLGFFSRRNGSYHIPIVGVDGIGKSQLLHTVAYLLQDMIPELPVRHQSAARFAEEGENESRFYELLDDLRGNENVIMLLDDCGDDKRIIHSLKKLDQAVENAFLLTAWSPEYWRFNQEEIVDTISVSEEVELNPFTEAASIEAISVAVETYSEGRASLPNEFYKTVHEEGVGIPGLEHELCRRSLKRSFLGEYELGDPEAVRDASEQFNLTNATDRVYAISDKKLTILKHILLSRHPKGCRPSELVELLDRDKSTVSYHLQNLVDSRVLEKERQGRSVFYRIDEALRPIVQRRVAQEGEFYA